MKDELFKFIVESDPTMTTKFQDLSLSSGLEKDLHYNGDYIHQRCNGEPTVTFQQQVARQQ